MIIPLMLRTVSLFVALLIAGAVAADPAWSQSPKGEQLAASETEQMILSIRRATLRALTGAQRAVDRVTTDAAPGKADAAVEAIDTAIAVLTDETATQTQIDTAFDDVRRKLDAVHGTIKPRTIKSLTEQTTLGYRQFSLSFLRSAQKAVDRSTTDAEWDAAQEVAAATLEMVEATDALIAVSIAVFIDETATQTQFDTSFENQRKKGDAVLEAKEKWWDVYMSR